MPKQRRTQTGRTQGPKSAPRLRSKRVRQKRNQQRLEQYNLEGRQGKGIRMVVAKPYCTPARFVLTGVLNRVNGPSLNMYIQGLRELPPVLISPGDAAIQWGVEKRVRENLKFGPAAPTFLPWKCQCEFMIKPGYEHLAPWLQDVIDSSGLCYVTERTQISGRIRETAQRRRGSTLPRTRKEPNTPDCSKGQKEWSWFQDAIDEASDTPQQTEEKQGVSQSSIRRTLGKIFGG